MNIIDIDSLSKLPSGKMASFVSKERDAAISAATSKAKPGATMWVRPIDNTAWQVYFAVEDLKQEAKE